MIRVNDARIYSARVTQIRSAARLWRGPCRSLTGPFAPRRPCRQHVTSAPHRAGTPPATQDPFSWRVTGAIAREVTTKTDHGNPLCTVGGVGRPVGGAGFDEGAEVG